MANKRNFQRELDAIIERQTEAPTLLLHSCCAPCSSHCLEYLAQHFRITVFYYNPNIDPQGEYERRVAEQQRLIREMAADGRLGYPVEFIEGHYDPQEFYEAVKGLEEIPEGGARCFACFLLRLGEAARVAVSEKTDYVTTTLTISPLKNAQKLNEIGEAVAKEAGTHWLPSDFKKKNGYKRSCELSAEYGLYRQDYCGCVFSKREREKQRLHLEG